MKNLFNIFNPDNKIANFLTKIMYLAWLNFLWLLCSLPIVTIGASTTAVYYTAMRMARDDEGYIARDFFHSFKENFLQATGVWLIVLVFFGMICFNWWNLSGSPNDLLRIASHLFLSLFVIFALIFISFRYCHSSICESWNCFAAAFLYHSKIFTGASALLFFYLAAAL